MALKIRTNVKRKKSTKESSDKNDNPSIPNTEKNPRYDIRQISNGWIVTKSWNNEKNEYKSEEIYHENKPEGLDKLENGD